MRMGMGVGVGVGVGNGYRTLVLFTVRDCMRDC